MEEVFEIEKCIKRLRGGAQAQLVQANSRFYVAKFQGNPQGNRTLVNERIVDSLAQRIGLSVAPTAILHLSDALLARTQLMFTVGKSSVPVRSGLHFGSLCPVDPTLTAIYEVLPPTLMCKVTNLYDLGLVYAFDRWIGQTDRRQAIFIKRKQATRDLQFRMFLIDHGLSFAGSKWQFWDSPGFGLWVDPRIYRSMDMHQLCMEAVDRINSLPETDIRGAASAIPEAWITAGDRSGLSRLLEQLHFRRKMLPALIDRHLTEMENKNF